MSQQQRSLEDRLEQLEEKRLEDNELRGRVEAELRQKLAHMENRFDELEAEVERARGDAAAAYEAVVDGEDETKTGQARALVRDELVRRTAVDVAIMERPVTNKEVREMAKPDKELDWQTVDNAFGQLIERWPCFRLTEKRDEKALTVDRDAVPRELVRLVERSLDRDGLAKEVFGG